MRTTGTRDRLVSIASDLFYRKGFGGTSFEEIVQRSGIQRGNIYHYFKTKDEILEAVVESRLREQRETTKRWSRDSVDPLVRLERIVDMVFGRASDLARFGCPIGTLTSELGKGRGERKALVRDQFDIYRDYAAEQFRTLGFTPARSRELALELLARCQGAAVLTHAYGDRKLLERGIAGVRTWLRDCRAEQSPRRSKAR